MPEKDINFPWEEKEIRGERGERSLAYTGPPYDLTEWANGVRMGS